MADNENQRVTRLEREVSRLTEEMNSFRDKCRNGFYVFETKQSLQNFEENLALYLYPRDRIFGRTEIFPRLMTWLNIRRDTPHRLDAKDRWLQVKREAHWNPCHENVLTKLRNLLPDVSQPVALWHPVSFHEEERRCIADLDRLGQRLTELIEEEENEREQIEAL
jgi:hypothetical protein